MVFDPIVTPPKIITLDVIQTLAPMITGFAIIVEKSFISCVDVIIILRKEKEHLFPIKTGAYANINVSAKPTLLPK